MAIGKRFGRAWSKAIKGREILLCFYYFADAIRFFPLCVHVRELVPQACFSYPGERYYKSTMYLEAVLAIILISYLRRSLRNTGFSPELNKLLIIGMAIAIALVVIESAVPGAKALAVTYTVAGCAVFRFYPEGVPWLKIFALGHTAHCTDCTD
jgi:hypothetical protein